MSTLVIIFHQELFDDPPERFNKALEAHARLPTAGERLIPVKTADGVLLVAYDDTPTEADKAALSSAIAAHPCDRCVMLVHRGYRTSDKVRLAQTLLAESIEALNAAEVRQFSHAAGDPFYEAVLRFLDDKPWHTLRQEPTGEAIWSRLRHDIVALLAPVIVWLEDAEERASRGDAAGAAASRDAGISRLEQARHRGLASVERAREDLRRETQTGVRLAGLLVIEGQLVMDVEPVAAKVHEWRETIVKAFSNPSQGMNERA